MIAKFDNYR